MKRRTAFSLEPLEGRSLLSGLATSLTTDGSSYQAGQPVVMTFQETNTSNTPTSVMAGPSTDGFDVMQAGRVVWRSNGGINPLFIQVVPLGPGQSLTLTATWDGIPQGGSSPVAGTFEIVNQLDPHGASATITIGGSASPSPSSPHTSNPGASGDPLPSPSSSSSPSPSGTTSAGPVGTGPITMAPGAADPPLPAAGVKVTMNHPAYRVGHPIHMTMVVQEHGGKPHARAMGRVAGSFEVLDGAAVVWSSTAKQPPRVGHCGAVRLSAVWNGRDAQTGAPAAPGTYTILAQDGNASGSTTIRIRR
ncbi:MAG: hypothetical protein ACYC61_11515 [Isosphaeraceae bacterium]